MKNVIKILSISLIFIILLGNLICVNAAPNKPSVADRIMGTITNGWGEWLLQDDDVVLDTDIKLNQSSGNNQSKGIIERAIMVMQTLGSVVSVIALMIIGFRYMFASVEAKAEMKGVLIYYIIGAVLVFATSNILGIAYDVITSIKI